MPNAHSDRPHRTLGGSTAHQWVPCPGSVFFKKKLPPQPTSEAAEEGTVAHGLLEKALADFLQYKETGNAPEMPFLEECGNSGSHDDEMLLHVATAVEVIWDKVFEKIITGKAYGQEDEFVLSLPLDMGGFVDLWVIYIDDRGHRVGVVFDFKYGYHQVHAEKNAQLAFYACAMRAELRAKGKDLDYVRTAIYQPRISVGDKYKESKITGKQLDAWEKKFMKAAEQIFVKQKPTYKAGEWCRFCPAKAICPAHEKDVSTSVALKLTTADLGLLPMPESLSDERLVNIVRNSEKVSDFLSACEKFARAKLLNGDEIPGLKLVQGTGRRSWIDETERVISILQQHNITDATEQKLKGITKIEPQLKKLHGNEASAAIMESITQKSSPAPALVDESDPRPAIASGIKLLQNIE